MPETGDSDPFESTEEYYASYRPGCGEEVIEYLVERFGLDGSARVLDLSYCSPATFEDGKDAFEADLRALLADRREESFVRAVTVEVISGKR